MGVARIEEVVNFKKVLDVYLETSSQQINESKSQIILFNTPIFIQRRISSILHF